MPEAASSTLVVSIMGPGGDAQLPKIRELIVAQGGQVQPAKQIDNEAWQLPFTLAKDFDCSVLPTHADLEVVVHRSVHRVGRRLVVLDMDSTLIQTEVIDELARAHGVLSEVSEMTRRAMEGELDYVASLRARVRLLRGLSFSHAERIARTLPLTDGAQTLVTELRGQTHHTAVISGGFMFAASALKERLGLHEAHANTLIVKDGVLTGEVEPDIVCPDRKAELLASIAARENIPLSNSIAVGDGANDLKMLSKAGLGIAFHAKEAVAKRCRVSLRRQSLDRVLLFL